MGNSGLEIADRELIMVLLGAVEQDGGFQPGWAAKLGRMAFD